jgi:hypothetical protein
MTINDNRGWRIHPQPAHTLPSRFRNEQYAGGKSTMQEPCMNGRIVLLRQEDMVRAATRNLAQNFRFTTEASRHGPIVGAAG